MKKLNKILAASSLALMASVGANAATTDSVTITATVPQVLDVLVTPVTNTFTLTNGVTYTGLVANANASANVAYDLQVSSANSQVLTDTVNNISYTVAIDKQGVCATFASCAQPDLSLGLPVVVGSGVASVPDDYNVFVEVQDLAFAGLPAGDYSDTLNFEIVAQ